MPGLMLAVVGITFGSAVDLAAFGQGIVGGATVPSAAARVLVGCLCLLSAVRTRRPSNDIRAP